jgi:hypothetical protein
LLVLGSGYGWGKLSPLAHIARVQYRYFERKRLILMAETWVAVCRLKQSAWAGWLRDFRSSSVQFTVVETGAEGSLSTPSEATAAIVK